MVRLYLPGLILNTIPEAVREWMAPTKPNPGWAA